ncbi:hypothetical protein GGI43DRAFT_237999 [Trichoderma evansii]
MRYDATRLPASACHGLRSTAQVCRLTYRAGETQSRFVAPGALVDAEQPIFGYNALGLALFLSDLHLLPTGLILSWVEGVPLILPGCPHSQRQVVAWAGDSELQFIRRMATRPLWTIVVVFEIFI